MAEIEQILTDGDHLKIHALDKRYGGSKTRQFHVNGNGGVYLNGTTNGDTSDKAVLSGAAAFAQVSLGRATTGAVTIAGAKVGDKVGSVTNITTPGDASAAFETTVSVAGQVQQTSAATDYSAKVLIFTLNHQTPQNS